MKKPTVWEAHAGLVDMLTILLKKPLSSKEITQKLHTAFKLRRNELSASAVRCKARNLGLCVQGASRCGQSQSGKKRAPYKSEKIKRSTLGTATMALVSKTPSLPRIPPSRFFDPKNFLWLERN